MAEPRPSVVVHADLAAGLPALPADAGDVDLYLWWRGTPLGHLELTGPPPPDRVLAERIAERVGPAVGERLPGTELTAGDPVAGLPDPTDPPALEPLLALDRPLSALPDPAPADAGPSVSVAVCTRGRPDALARCLASLARSERGWTELLVVDDGPSEDTRAVVAGWADARYVPAPAGGLSSARNVALREAAGAVIAFVDDDTEVDRRWLGRLRGHFADPGVASVTGLVLPASLEAPAQVVFEKVLGGFSRGYRALTFDPAFLARTRRHAPPVWKVGAGANMALRRGAVQAVGGFDERLGAGAAGCSEDSELWYRLLAAGWTCRYEPASVVHHHHRTQRPQLERQTHDYLRGHVAALFVQFARHRHAGNLRRALVHIPRHLARQTSREATLRALARLRVAPGGSGRPLLAELRGYARGLGHAGLALTNEPPMGKQRLGPFLRRNPYPHPRTGGFFYREKMRAIHRVAPDLPAARVLEIGGGRSGLARLLYPGAAVVTADLDPTLADSDVHREARTSFVVADATALPFPDGSFDVVTLFDVLEHIPDDAAAAREAVRVVRPGGWILVTTPSLRWRSPYHRVMRPICFGDEEMMRRWGHVRRGYAIGDLERLFGAAVALRADFLTPATVIGHDVAFSRLPERVALTLNALLSPFTWAAYAAQPDRARGTEIAASWQRRQP